MPKLSILPALHSHNVNGPSPPEETHSAQQINSPQGPFTDSSPIDRFDRPTTDSNMLAPTEPEGKSAVGADNRSRAIDAFA